MKTKFNDNDSDEDLIVSSKKDKRLVRTFGL